MPENQPNPTPPKRSQVADTVIRAERLTQIAFILPVAVVIGWLGGLALDHWLHQHWIYLAGIILGCAAGFVEIFRLVATQEKALDKEDKEDRPA